MSNSKIILVNELDEVVGTKLRSDIKDTDICRVSALWIENSAEKILLAQRSLLKKNSPGRWGPAVAGTVEVGETYESNIKKEAMEEIGLDLKIFHISFHKLIVSYQRKFQLTMFHANLDLDVDSLQLQKEEVEQLKWFTKAELESDLLANPHNYVKAMTEYFDYFKSASIKPTPSVH